jgi:glycosyltransferase involved in cell wall biosynthesis
MNVLVVTCIYPEGTGKDRSPAGVFIEDEVKALRSHGHAVTVLTGAKREDKRVIENGVTILRVKAHGPFFSLLHTIQTLQSTQFDVVHAGFADFSALFSYVIGRLKGRPLVVSVQGYEVRSIKLRKNLGMLLNRILYIVTRFVLKTCDAVIVHSFFLKRQVERHGVASNKIYVVRPVLRDTFIGLARQPDEAVSQTILTVATLVPGKGIEHGIRAMKEILKEVPLAKYVIVGDGHMKRQYLDLARRLGVGGSVEFLGRIPPHDVYRYYQSSFVYLLPSDHESFGISKIEANACGKAVVARDAEGIGEGITHGYNGYLFSDNNEIAGYVVKLLKDKKLRLKMEENCRREAEKYGPDRYARQMERIYEDLLKDRGAS